jgi:hypothetical protein
VPLDADRAEGDARLPGGVGPAVHQGQHLLRAGVGGEVEVVVEPAEQRVADRAADQVQGVAGGGEALAELDRHGRHPHQLADGVVLRLRQRGRRRSGGTGHGGRAYGAPAAPARRALPGRRRPGERA